MPHIPDGVLEAYLDGEIGDEGADASSLETHLSTCEECRARLAAAGWRRERAGGLLEGVPAEAGAPAFESVLARAGRSPPPDAAETGRHARPRRFRRIPLAWAASVLISAGAGWFGRRAILGDAPRTPSQPPAARLVEEMTQIAAADRVEHTAESEDAARSLRPTEQTEGAKVAAKRVLGEAERVGALAEGSADGPRDGESAECLRLILDARAGSPVDAFLAGSRDLLGDTTLLPRDAVRGPANEEAVQLTFILPIGTGALATGPVAGIRLEVVPCGEAAGEVSP